MRHLLLLALLAGPSALAQTINGTLQAPANALTLADSGQTRTLDCTGQNVVIAGSDNTLTLTGRCNFVNVTGSRNTLSVSEVYTLQLTGNDNRVTWTKRPRYVFIQANTTGNTVGRAP